MTKITQGLWNLGVNTLSRTNLIPSAGRVKMLRSFGFRIGEGSSVRSRCYFRSANVIIGEKSWINNECFFDNKSNCRVSLGNHCAVGMQVLFCSSTHKVGNASQRAGADDNKGITIDDGCWIGARATILPGVHVYSGCVIAAGAVVVSDCEKNGLYAGVPARRVKELVV